MDPSRLVFVDESGVNVGMNRLYGWAPKGEQAIITQAHKGKRLSIVGAMAADGPRGKMTFTGTLDGPGMVEYVQDHLGPTLRIGDVVVLDGAPIHKVKGVREAIEKFGASMIILPPYSPELNPIEHLWSTLKARIRATGAPTWSELGDLLEKTWNNLDLEFFRNWVVKCGYLAST